MRIQRTGEKKRRDDSEIAELALKFYLQNNLWLQQGDRRAVVFVAKLDSYVLCPKVLPFIAFTVFLRTDKKFGTTATFRQIC